MDRRSFLAATCVVPVLDDLGRRMPNVPPDRWLELRVTLPPYPNRDTLGEIRLCWSDGTAIKGPWRVFGRAGNDVAALYGNPGRDPARAYGDTPTGRFKADFLFFPPTPAYSEKTYGNSMVVVMSPISGLAKTSCRTGIWIHGGDLTADGALRPTGGCLRMKNGDLDLLFARLMDEDLAPIRKLEVVVLEQPATGTPPQGATTANDPGVLDPAPLPRANVARRRMFS